MQIIPLPKPRLDSDFSVERALAQRRTVRDFAVVPLTLDEAAQILWAAQGVTHREGLRTAPSAGALYPLETLLVAGNVAGLAPGVYAYIPAQHTLKLVVTGDRRAALAQAALGQRWMEGVPAIVVFCSVGKRTSGKYGSRGMSYIYLEIGHAAENVFLQAQALGIGAAVVGAFNEAQVAASLMLSPEQRPLYLMPVGRPAAP